MTIFFTLAWTNSWESEFSSKKSYPFYFEFWFAFFHAGFKESIKNLTLTQIVDNGQEDEYLEEGKGHVENYVEYGVFIFSAIRLERICWLLLRVIIVLYNCRHYHSTFYVIAL